VYISIDRYLWMYINVNVAFSQTVKFIHCFPGQRQFLEQFGQHLQHEQGYDEWVVVGVFFGADRAVQPNWGGGRRANRLLPRRQSGQIHGRADEIEECIPSSKDKFRQSAIIQLISNKIQQKDEYLVENCIFHFSSRKI
jgi:hypothetical protein